MLLGRVYACREFLSTPSARRATHAFCNAVVCRRISIHALREEGDWTMPPLIGSGANFYPRPPRGGRLGSRHSPVGSVLYFYPRPPRGGRHILFGQ